MLNIVNKNQLNNYLLDDWIEKSINDLLDDKVELYTSDKWLLESASKRCIYDLLYGDISSPRRKLRILDVGGGLSSLSATIFQNSDYEVLDLFHHQSCSELKKFCSTYDSVKLIQEDWEKFELSHDYDFIIANDLFPNVDQRLDEFINKFSSYCTELRLSLTYYNSKRCYKVKRVDADEYFFIKPFNGKQLHSVLESLIDPLDQATLEKLKFGKSSIFQNGRQVCTSYIRGKTKSEKKY